MNKWRLVSCAIIVLFAATSCSSSAPQMSRPSYDYPEASYSYSEASTEQYADEGMSVASSGSGGSSRSKASHTRADSNDHAELAAPDSASQTASPQTPETAVGARNANAGAAESAPTRETSTQTAPLLIYNGTILLALYDVAETQKKVIEVVESEGGWVSTRSTNQLVLRVPAPKFRAMLDQLSKMGDLLDLQWQAEDVTTVVRDTRIRLDSALKMHERLQDLLNKAENVKDALAIEEQLGRVILEIEQLQATLRGYQDRIAYSTITINFRPKTDRNVPANAYTLPFHWLQELGVNRLLQIPGR